MDTRKWLPSVAFVFLVLCTLIREGLGIKCYMCNSKRNEFNCKNLDRTNPNSVKMEQDCDELEPAVKGQANYTVCRKLYQTIIDDEGYEEVRVIRQCGTAGKIGCNFQSRPGTLTVITCHCNSGDLCNAATSVQRLPVATVTALTALGLLLWAGHRR